LVCLREAEVEVDCDEEHGHGEEDDGEDVGVSLELVGAGVVEHDGADESAFGGGEPDLVDHGFGGELLLLGADGGDAEGACEEDVFFVVFVEELFVSGQRVLEHRDGLACEQRLVDEALALEQHQVAGHLLVGVDVDDVAGDQVRGVDLFHDLREGARGLVELLAVDTHSVRVGHLVDLFLLAADEADFEEDREEDEDEDDDCVGHVVAEVPDDAGEELVDVEGAERFFREDLHDGVDFDARAVLAEDAAEQLEVFLADAVDHVEDFVVEEFERVALHDEVSVFVDVLEVAVLDGDLEVAVFVELGHFGDELFLVVLVDDDHVGGELDFGLAEADGDPELFVPDERQGEEAERRDAEQQVQQVSPEVASDVEQLVDLVLEVELFFFLVGDDGVLAGDEVALHL